MMQKRWLLFAESAERVAWGLTGGRPRWGGLVVLVVGGVAALFGILHALVARDLKRLLAYSTTENVGLVLVGVGAGASFTVDQPVVAALLVHLSSVLDGSDGEVARLNAQESGYGGYLDAVLDRLAGSLVLVGGLVFLLESPSLRTIIRAPAQGFVGAAAGAAAGARPSARRAGTPRAGRRP